MKKLLLPLIMFPILQANASMFDDSGNYTGNWKQMTYTQNKQKNYDYSYSTWYANNKKIQNSQKQQSFSTENYKQTSTQPFRYNTLNYTRVRNVQGGHGQYNAKCSDIGDVSFCR